LLVETVILCDGPTRPLSWTRFVSGSYHVLCTFPTFSSNVTRFRLQGDTVLPRKDFAVAIWKRKLFFDFAVNGGSRPLKNIPESWSNGRDEPTYFPRERPHHSKITARNIWRGLGGFIIYLIVLLVITLLFTSMMLSLTLFFFFFFVIISLRSSLGLTKMVYGNSLSFLFYFFFFCRKNQFRKISSIEIHGIHSFRGSLYGKKRLKILMI
jgi:hypothetical protein